MLIELSQKVRETQVFLKMAAIQLRRLAERAPDIAVELQRFAQQLEAEVEDLAAALPNGDSSGTDGVLDEPV